ncbi:MAG: class I SAM-dependent methyltransferase [Patescibacteria group bacterium]
MDPQPNARKLGKYYQNNFDYSAGKANEKIIRTRAQQILKSFKPKSSIRVKITNSTILDIGSGYGYFLHEAKKNDYIVQGVEPNSKLAHDSINQIIKSIYFGTFEEFYKKSVNMKFDFITIIHTIEHLRDPKKIIKMACNLLSKDGVLYIETPNLDSHLFYREKQDYTFLTPPDHLWIFSRKSFEYVIPKNYEVFKISSYSYPEHFMGILKSIYRKKSLEYLSKNISNQGADNDKKKRFTLKQKIQIFLFDRLFARIFYRLLNLKYHGSILELYIRKK